MTEALFLADDLSDPLPPVGAAVTLAGAEGRHAAVVRRIRSDERIVLSDGHGRAVRGRVTAVERDGLTVEVTDQLELAEPSPRFVAVQALAKGDRSDLAVEMLTEMGISEIVPWQASRSIVRWTAERGIKARTKWQATAREAAKQSRRLRVPDVAEVTDTAGLAERVAAADLALILHEGAVDALADVPVPSDGTVLLIIGPEGGIDDTELHRLTEAGGRPVLVSDGVLRTSTAGVVALAGLRLRPAAAAPFAAQQ